MDLKSQTNDPDLGLQSPPPETTRRYSHPGVLRCSLAEANGVASLLELLAGWLTQTMDVRAVAFWNVRTREHYITCPGHPRQGDPLLSLVHEVMDGPSPRLLHWRQCGHYFHIWTGTPMERWERLLIAEKENTLSAEEANAIMRQALTVLMPSLQAFRVAERSGSAPS
ncbi:MAG: hypothetical protein HQL66_02340 [Magnetococcales bacterium]|nr:hypothetical protein [Magnetococcales bacterium]